jgi:hypothetical protein
MFYEVLMCRVVCAGKYVGSSTSCRRLDFCAGRSFKVPRVLH